MTNHWDIELKLITLGRKAASPYMGTDTDTFINTTEKALRALEMVIEERDNMMEELHNRDNVHGYSPFSSLDELITD